MDDLTDALRAGGDGAVDPAAASERAARRLAAAADERGLLDVAYAIVDSPLGPLRAATTRRGLVMLAVRRRAARRPARPRWPSGCRRGSWRRPPASTRCGASWTSTSRAGGATSTSPSTGR